MLLAIPLPCTPVSLHIAAQCTALRWCSILTQSCSCCAAAAPLAADIQTATDTSSTDVFNQICVLCSQCGLLARIAAAGRPHPSTLLTRSQVRFTVTMSILSMPSSLPLVAVTPDRGLQQCCEIGVSMLSVCLRESQHSMCAYASMHALPTRANARSIHTCLRCLSISRCSAKISRNDRQRPGPCTCVQWTSWQLCSWLRVCT